MIRTQIQLPEDLHAQAKALAKQQERSLAEIVRRALEELMDQYPFSGRFHTQDDEGLFPPARNLGYENDIDWDAVKDDIYTRPLDTSDQADR